VRIFTFCLLLLIAACTMTIPAPGAGVSVSGETGVVTHIVDGDTFDVQLSNGNYRVRYIGINTPERNEPCYQDATNADAMLISGKTVTLVKDVSDTDQYGRLLRYVYVGNDFINADLVREGWAENAEYPPDTAHAAEFRALEAQAKQANIGCHPTGIFDDGSPTR
jgi:endonuclease YncB( thermonuclease family)